LAVIYQFSTFADYCSSLCIVYIYFIYLMMTDSSIRSM